MKGTEPIPLGKTFNDVVSFTHYLRLVDLPPPHPTKRADESKESLSKDPSDAHVRSDEQSDRPRSDPMGDSRGAAWCTPMDVVSESTPPLRSLTEHSTIHRYGVTVDRVRADTITVADFQAR